MNLPGYPDAIVTSRIMDAIPVEPSQTVAAHEYASRLVQILRLVDIDAEADERGGIEFGGRGVGLEDQPLVAALESLVSRRFDQPR
jgi:hypothetical protein